MYEEYKVNRDTLYILYDI